MVDVACFCGCLYSFEGAGAACPACGEYAAVMPAAASTSTGRSQQQGPPVTASVSTQNGHSAQNCPEWEFVQGLRPVSARST